LFTDDDVRPSENWIAELAEPLIRDECDAVVGRITLAPHLARPWLTENDKIWLACPELAWDPKALELVGANMGFHRRVLKRVPQFDPELGPGAIGFGDDSLFSYQLVEAGFRVRAVPEAVVTHDFEASRLQRREWLANARKRARASAYLAHHWFQRDIRNPHLQLARFALKLYLRRILQPPPPLSQEGRPDWEISYVFSLELCKAYLKERVRPRRYSKTQ
jgi:GT2 family glycosyltransferase